MANAKELWSSVIGTEFGEVRVDRDKAKKQAIRHKAGCFRFALGKIVTKEEFEAKKKSVFKIA